ncbi:MAG: hypothetical protein KF893_01650 [Caldilineaceae bacterium]|nr:hypothetical protein [Caldilineaceae bacterium]
MDVTNHPKFQNSVLVNDMVESTFHHLPDQYKNFKTGATELLNTPLSTYRPDQLLIATRRSLISAGTERMLVDFGQGNRIAKARAQADKVRQVLTK